jgi:integrase/recombinase XerD
MSQSGFVVVLPGGSGARGPVTVNRYLAGVFGFYDHHARTGLPVAAELVSWRRMSRGSYKPFLYHVTKGRPIPVRPVKLHVPRRAPRTLEPGQIVAVHWLPRTHRTPGECRRRPVRAAAA